MLRFTKRFEGHIQYGSRTDALVLEIPFEIREKSRFIARARSGEDVGVALDRGRVLRGGDMLISEEGTLLRIVAANETVSTVDAPEARALARAAYHLGNRHVALQVGESFVRYRHDHVLDDMIRGLGLDVRVEEAPFEPEPGAYGHASSHTHAHRHDAGGAENQ